MRTRKFAAALALALTLLAACSKSEDTAAPASNEPAVSSQAPSPTGNGACDFTPPATPAAGTQYDKPPKMTIDPSKSYTATIDTSCGTMTVNLLPKDAPETVNNFVFLANEGWYDGIRFHRIIAGFVIQAGDPLCSDRNNQACGSGGPGYKFKDELSGKERYSPGTVAMANAGPDTNGSQFFIVTGPDAGSLPPSYTVFGELADQQSLKVAQTIEQLPVTGDAPTDDIWIRNIKVEER